MSNSELSVKVRCRGLLDHLLNCFNQRINKEMVFGEVPVGTVFHEFGQQLLVSLAGEDNHGNFAVYFPDLLQCFKTVQPVAVPVSKNVIEHNEAGILVKVFETLLPGLITDHMIILPALKCVLQQVQDHSIIVNEKYQSAHKE